jgi:hypothetical protein
MLHTYSQLASPLKPKKHCVCSNYRVSLNIRELFFQKLLLRKRNCLIFRSSRMKNEENDEF